MKGFSSTAHVDSATALNALTSPTATSGASKNRNGSGSFSCAALKLDPKRKPPCEGMGGYCSRCPAATKKALWVSSLCPGT